MLDRDVRGLVTPVLEELTLGGGGRDQRAGVGAEPGEERELLAAHEHVHGVDLDQARAVEDATQVAPVDAALRTGIGETLGGKRDATDGSQRQDGRTGAGHEAPTI